MQKDFPPPPLEQAICDIYMCDITLHIYFMIHDSFLYVTRLILLCDMSRP